MSGTAEPLSPSQKGAFGNRIVNGSAPKAPPNPPPRGKGTTKKKRGRPKGRGGGGYSRSSRTRRKQARQRKRAEKNGAEKENGGAQFQQKSSAISSNPTPVATTASSFGDGLNAGAGGGSSSRASLANVLDELASIGQVRRLDELFRKRDFSLRSAGEVGEEDDHDDRSGNGYVSDNDPIHRVFSRGRKYKNRSGGVIGRAAGTPALDTAALSGRANC